MLGSLCTGRVRGYWSPPLITREADRSCLRVGTKSAFVLSVKTATGDTLPLLVAILDLLQHYLIVVNWGP